MSTASPEPVTGFATPPIPDPLDLEVVGARCTITNEWGQPIEVLPVEDYRVTVEEGRIPTRTIDIDMPGDERWAPKRYYEYLDPRSDTQVRAEVLLTDGTYEYWRNLAVGILTEDSLSRGEGQYGFTLNIPDRSAAPWWPLEGGIAIESGTSLEDVCALILASTRTPVALNVGTPTGIFFPACVIGEYGNNPWGLASDLAQSLGAVMYLDQDGLAWITKIVGPDATEPWRIYEPTHDQMDLISLEWNLSMSDSADGVIVPWTGGHLLYPDVFITRPLLWEGDASLLLTEADARTAAAAFMILHEGVLVQPSIKLRIDAFADIGKVIGLRDPGLGIETVLKTRVTGIAFAPKSNVMELRVAGVRAVAA